MIRKYLYVFTLVVTIPVALMSVASAAQTENLTDPLETTGIRQCSGGNIHGWDWPGQIKTLPHQSGTKIPDTLFDPDTTDYIIFLTQTNGTTTRNSANGFAYTYNMIDAGTGGNLIVFTYEGNHYFKNVGTQNQNLARLNFNLHDSYKPYDTNWFASVVSTSSNSGSTSAYAADHPLYGSTPLSPSSIACVQAMHGVTYDPSYTGPKYKTKQGYTTGGGAQCAQFNIGCHLANAFSTVTQAIKDFVVEVFEFFYRLFVPSGEAVGQIFDDFTLFMEVKLGFLVWPFEVLVDLFQAFGGEGTWCSPSNCKWSGGTMGGGTLTMDVLALKNNDYAPIWNMGLLFIRGTSILMLIGLLHRKFLEITTK